MDSLTEKINSIKESILKFVPARYIYLFGSYAYGNPTAESDIDIYVVTPDNISNFSELYAKIIGDLGDKKIFFIDLMLVFCPQHLATSLPCLWVRFFAAKPRHKPIMAAFCGFKSHPKSTAIITQSVADRTLGCETIFNTRKENNMLEKMICKKGKLVYEQ